MAKSKANKANNGNNNNNNGKQSLVKITAPVAVATQKKMSKAPQVSYTSDGCRIKHMEYMVELTTNALAPLSTQSYTINPQRTQVFPWLSAIATRFEMYKFNKLKFTFKPSCGTGTPGYIAFGFDFDFYDEAPGKATMLAWRYSTKTTPWAQTSLDVSSDSRVSTFRYNNFDSLKGDARLDFLGNLWIIIDTNSAPFETIGEMYVEYDVTFRQPSYKIPPALYAQFKGNDVSGPTSSAFGSIVQSFGNILYEKVSGSTIRIKDVGQFLVTLNSFITGGTFSGLPGISVTGPTGSVWFDEDTGVITNPAATNGTVGRHIKVDTAPVDVSFSVPIAAGSSLSRVLISTFGEKYANLF